MISPYEEPVRYYSFDDLISKIHDAWTRCYRSGCKLEFKALLILVGLWSVKKLSMAISSLVVWYNENRY